MSKFKHRLYNLNIESEIKLPTSLASFDESDVVISFGRVPSKLDNPIAQSNNVVLNAVSVIEEFENVATFYVTSNRIIIQKEKNASDIVINLYLTGVIMGILLLLRSRISLHGSAIRYMNKTILLIGDSGSGKSSLSSGLLSLGGQMISDDVIALSKSENSIVISKGISEQRLSKQIIDSFELHPLIIEKIVIGGFETEKFFVDRSSQMTDDFSTADLIINLNVSKDSLEINELKGTSKLDTLLRNVYCSSYVKPLRKEKVVFENVSIIAQKTRIFNIKRENNKNQVNEMIELLRKCL